MGVKENCERCTDDEMCRKHFLIGVVATVAKAKPEFKYD